MFLFLAVHVYSDLAQLNSQALMNGVPDSQEVIQLNAENFEKRHDLKKTIAEYRVLLQRAPEMPEIHYRIAGLIMSQPPTAASAEEARKEFEAELKIFPGNAGAEYYLGELARQKDKLPEDQANSGPRRNALRFRKRWIECGAAARNRSETCAGESHHSLHPRYRLSAPGP